MRKGNRGFSFLDVLALVTALAVLVGLFVLYTERGRRRREAPAHLRCRNNLNQLAKGMATYLVEYGSNTWYPCPLERGATRGTYNGAEWLAALYWTGVVPDPRTFLCWDSGDTNADGKDIGSHRANDCGGTFGPQTISYAGMWWKSVNTITGGAIKDDRPPEEPMACDDTQGGINHGTATNGGMAVLFFDSHVEFKTNTEIDLERGVGMKPGLLWRLKN